MSDVNRQVADLEGLPRKNGELVFEAPWQSRAFGMAVALNEQGTFEWNAFRQRLIDEVGRSPADREFYASWVSAFERLVLERRMLTSDELTQRAAEFRSMQREEVF
jgi:nitrile hydratase accessory protein